MNIPLNISWNEHEFQYLIGMDESVSNLYDYDIILKFSNSNSDPGTEISPQDVDYVQFTTDNLKNLTCDGNIYYNNVTGGDHPEYIPSFINSRKIHFQFPWYKINNYRNTEYVVKFTTWIAGVRILLGCYRITPDDFKATTYKVYKGGRYAEECELYIIDPWSIIYDEAWKDFRQYICGEDPEDSEINNTVSTLEVELTPIEYTGDYYNIIENAGIGSYSMVVSKQSDLLSLNLEFEPLTSNLRMNLNYNEVYDNIVDYLQETYGIVIDPETVTAEYILSVTDKENEYGELTKILNENIEKCTFEKSELGLTDWSDYKDGLFLIGSSSICSDNTPQITIVSNPLPLTPDIYRFLIITDLDQIPIELKNVDMIDYTINAVNKINKTIVQVDNTKDTKSGLIHPVFFRSGKIDNTIIHPEVTENICINLNQYKSKVDMFYIKVEGVVFPEISRTHSGVIFKIQGNLLPNKTPEGIIYILDKNKELVTSGNYKYIS